METQVVLSVPSLVTLRETITNWLHIPPEDADVIDVVVAAFRSNQMPGDPVWLLLIDASGGGKTELLRTVRNHTDAYFLSSLTDKTLISGYRDPKNPTKDPSLLPKLDGKVLVVKDLSPLLSTRRETRDKIISDLRDAYDGFSDQGRGNTGRQSYQVKFSHIAGTTLAVERFDAVDQELGERYVKVRARSEETSPKVKRAIANVGRDDPMREEIGRAVVEFLRSLPPQPQFTTVTEEFIEPLGVISDFTAIGRSHVPRDRNRQLLYVPRPEIGTRLGKELAKLFLALAEVRGKEKPDLEDLKTIWRVAQDCLPPNRLASLSAIKQYGGQATTNELAQTTRLPESTCKLVLDDLEVLDILEKQTTIASGNLKKNCWRMRREWSEKLANLPTFCA